MLNSAQPVSLATLPDARHVLLVLLLTPITSANVSQDILNPMEFAKPVQPSVLTVKLMVSVQLVQILKDYMIKTVTVQPAFSMMVLLFARDAIHFAEPALTLLLALHASLKTTEPSLMANVFAHRVSIKSSILITL